MVFLEFVDFNLLGRGTSQVFLRTRGPLDVGRHVEYGTEVRFKSQLNLSLTPVTNLAFILGTVGEEEYHLRL